MSNSEQFPQWMNRIGVFDLETTGTDVAECRIVSAHVGVLNAAGKELASRTWLADPQVPIPAEAAAVHGITTEHARQHGRPALEVTEEIVSSLHALLSQGVPVVAFNAAYDFSLLHAEAVRHGLVPLHDPSPIIDPLVIDKEMDRYRRGKRTLSALCELYGVTLGDNAHDASADAVAAGRLALELARRHPLAKEPRALHTQQVGWARTQAESLTEYFIRIGRLDAESSLDGTWPVRSAALEHADR